MAPKKIHYHLYILLFTLFLVTSSCEKRKQSNSNIKHNQKEINILLDQGHEKYEREEFDSSYYYFHKAKYLAESKKDTSRIIHSLSWMAQIQRNQGDNTGSEATSTEALPFLEKTNKYPFGETNIYIGMGNNYFNTDDNDKAIYYYKKAINSKTDEEIKSGILNNISIVYIKKGEYKKAIQLLLSLISKRKAINNLETFAHINDNLGDAYAKSGQPYALYYLNQGLKLRKQINDNLGSISSYYHLSEFYELINLNLSIKYALIAYKKATKLKSVDSRLNCLKKLIELNSGETAKNYALQYLHINDSITKVRQRAKNQYAKIRYDSKKEREENLQLKAQKIEQATHQKKKNILLYLIVGTITAIGIGITYLLLAKNRREKVKATYATEIRISKKLHDELANDVYQTMAFAETQDLSTTRNKEILLSNLDTIYSRTRNISKENITVETGPAFLSDFKEMMTDFNTHQVNVIANGLEAINWSTLESNAKIILYRVIQELLVNMKKHSQCSLVLLTFNLNGKKLEIDYMDNGIGATENQIKSKNGLQNVENRILAVKGIISFETNPNKGFKVRFTIPI